MQQDAEKIWQSVVIALGECLSSAPHAEIMGISISNQRETVVAWDRSTGTPAGPAISWQCRRTSDVTEGLKKTGVGQDVLAKTGLPLDPLFPASKIKWLQDQAATSRDLCVGTIDSWLFYRFTQRHAHVTDRSNASRTQLFNINTGEWDPDLCEIFGVNPAFLPKVEESQTTFGVTSGIPEVPDGLTIASAIGDSHAALFGHAAFSAGDTKVTFGTGSSIMVTAEEASTPEHGLTTTVAWSRQGKTTYALEGNILVSASIFPWTAEILGLERDVGKLMELAQSVEDSAGVSLVPGHVGLGAPHWQPDVSGLITGLRFSSTQAHIARAAADSLALQVADTLGAIEAGDRTIGTISVDGGPSANPFLMQLVANILDKPLKVCRMPGVSAFGAATLAGLEVGLWSDIIDLTKIDRGIHIVMPEAVNETTSKTREIWASAVRQCVH